MNAVTETPTIVVFKTLGQFEKLLAMSSNLKPLHVDIELLLLCTVGVLLLTLLALCWYFIKRYKHIIYNMKQTAIHSENLALEKERERIAMELHDGIGSKLVGFNYQLSGLQSRVLSDDSLGSILNGFNSVYKDVRSISHQLIPPSFKETNLDSIIESYINQFRSEFMQITYATYPMHFDWSKVDDHNLLELYRIIQELVSNTLKHAQASEIDLQLVVSDKYITLSYEDNGLGFSPKECTNGIGMLSIENRVLALQGRLICDSAPGKGTFMNIQLPIQSKSRKKRNLRYHNYQSA